ncbi:hypothetical protein LI82_07265 [Methanococcoides methylutens]|uniref:Uncharacterized protein n=1 Tax=Methanococcoides methylutens TaxID=2226 RepID=A0A099T0I8_METMT|nr:hypothetical protein [Methanococcoides methylutens]KGK98647.1 hypothetical protein LI82_07265 [Methanococcoides methylutens]
MDKTVVYGLIILFLGIAIGYSINDMATVEEVPVGLKVPEMSAYLRSAAENNTDSHIWFYDIGLYNSGDEAVYVNSVEPVFSKNFSKIVLEDNNIIVVDKLINGKSSVEVSGQVEFNTTGLSREEIFDSTDGNIIGYRISSTETIYHSWAEI